MAFDPLRIPLRLLMLALQRLRRVGWRARRPSVAGAHAIALTPAGAVILVKLRYASAWYLPGGGRKPGETAEQNALRELREEIGMVGHGAVTPLLEEAEEIQHRLDASSVFIVSGVRYRPRWSIEVEEILEADPRRLPADTTRRARRWIEAGLLTPGAVDDRRRITAEATDSKWRE